MYRYIYAMAFFLLQTITVWGTDGVIFSAKTAEGIDMTFVVISETEKTCQVGTGNPYEPAISSYSGSVTVPSTANGYTVIGVGSYSFCYSGSKLSSINLPNSITYIGNSAFSGCISLTSISLPNAITEIGERAFSECRGIKTIEFPSNLTSIGKYAFLWCSSLSSIVIPNTVTNIGKYAFSECPSLTSVILSNSLKTIQEGVFNSCEKLKEIEIPNGVTSIGSSAFSNCKSLSRIVIPNSVKSLGEGAFSGCSSSEEVVLSDIIKTIPKRTFSGCSNLKTITIPNSITTIDDLAFAFCTNLASVSMPHSLIAIGEKVFQECGSLTSITIPETVTSIGDDAFGWCTVLNVIKSEMQVPSQCKMGAHVFDDIGNNNRVLYVPHGTKDLYLAIPEWKYYFEPNIIEVNAYSLTITSIGNGEASFNGSVIRSNTSTFIVNEGSNATITFVPDNGYQIKSVKVDNADVTSNIINNQYTISNINKDTNVEVEFELIPPTTYVLSITATGNGEASYNNTGIRNTTKSFSVNEGSYPSVFFYPDNGYRVKSVKINGSSSAGNVAITLQNVHSNNTVEVEFEKIPPTTYIMSIRATDNGSVSYNSTVIRNTTKTFTVNEGTSATISFTPDDGHKIKSVKKDGTDVTSSVSNNKYTVSNIQNDTSIEVEFEAIPSATYTLSIKATGYGSVSYNSNTIRNATKAFTVTEGASATINIIPDDGYKIKTVKKDGTNVTSSVYGNKFAATNIQSNTSVEVEFEAITRTLYIKAFGNGYASYNSTTIRNTTKTFTINEGSSATISITPDDGYKIKSVKNDGTNVTSYVSGNKYSISNIQSDTSVEVEFEAITHSLSIKAIGNGVATYDGTNIRNKTTSFTVNEGSSAVVQFTPDNGYQIKSVKLNSTDITSNVYNSQYIISNITADTSLEVEFEAIPPTTYTLSIKAIGYGSTLYNSTTIRNATKSFTVNEGTSATISITPDDGYRIKSVKKDGADVTYSVSNNKYTVSNIQSDTSVEVEFENITHTLSIKATGNGVATYDGTNIRNKTTSFTVNEGSSAVVKFTPDNGCRIKSVKLNSTIVTSSVTNNQYTISNITADMSLEVEFEAIIHTLSIKATGYGAASYNSTTIRNTTKTFTVNEGTSATISFTSDNGYHIRGMAVDGMDRTSYISNNQYTVSNIVANISVEVEFEENVYPNANLLYTALAQLATKNAEARKTLTTSYADVVSEFEASMNSFDADVYALNQWYGSLNYSYVRNGVDIPNSETEDMMADINNVSTNIDKVLADAKDKHDTLRKEMSDAVDALQEKLNGVKKMIYEESELGTQFDTDIIKIQQDINTLGEDVQNDMSLNSESFEERRKEIDGFIDTLQSDATAYYQSLFVTLSVTTTGNGSASCKGTVIRNTTETFSIRKGDSPVITISSDNGYHIKSVKVNNVYHANVESQVTINNIMENTVVEVEFEANPTLFACEGVNYSVTSFDDKTVRLAKGNYGKVLEIPATISYMDTEWTVIGVDDDAFDNAEELAAIIWHPEVSFNATIGNPNLLLYVNKSIYAPNSVNNVVVNGIASSITLTDAESGNNFYCPQEFTAQHISYSHNYKMTTGIGIAKGWETIALPFDVQTVMHEEKGEIVPFAKWQSGDSTKPFWLMRLEENGWKAADGIKANTPYIISMPNNGEYKDEFLLNGRVTFSAENVTIRKTENMQTASYKGRTFVPTYSEEAMGSGFYVLNVSNDYETNVSGVDDGSRFVLNLRRVHPFEAYMITSTNGTRAIDISDGMDDGITEEEPMPMRVYNLKGLMMNTEDGKSMEEIKRTLPSGVYIINGHKMIVK